LIESIFLPEFRNPVLDCLEDQAVIAFGNARLAFTTDSFVVKPLFFRGGDIGSLAVHGTVNDLAMGGAEPLFLSVGFILEEGFELASLRRIVASMADAARAANVTIVTGDTKVVEKGSADGVFINTTGIGRVPRGIALSASNARPGDRILISGSLGDHGIAILSEREGIGFDCELQSDSAPLHQLVADMLRASDHIRCMRDPTRGGLASSLNEIAGKSKVGMVLDEESLVIRDEVQGACEMLGLDPLYVANEGKLVAIVAPDAADAVLTAMRRNPNGTNASIAGTVVAAHPGMVTVKTAFGTSRIVDMLSGDQLPRIC
jgi:hydrogenase expression/formation protein HypE